MQAQSGLLELQTDRSSFMKSSWFFPQGQVGFFFFSVNTLNNFLNLLGLSLSNTQILTSNFFDDLNM